MFMLKNCNIFSRLLYFNSTQNSHKTATVMANIPYYANIANRVSGSANVEAGSSNSHTKYGINKTKGRIRKNKNKQQNCVQNNFTSSFHMHSQYTNSFYNLPFGYQHPQKMLQLNAYNNMSNNFSQLSQMSIRRLTSGLTTDELNQKDEIGIGCRQWESTSPESKNPGQIFKLLCYNVLAQSLLDEHPHLYFSHKKKFLTWEARWERLNAEFKRYDCDIICLQEVQASHLEEFYTSAMLKLGYVGIYKKRTGSFPDGVAIFFKKKMFKLIEETSVEYRQTEADYLDRHNVGLIVKLAPRSNIQAEFVVATTHLLYNPKREDVRLAQTQLFLTEVERIAYQKGSASGSYLPIILCGDFNSEPNSNVLNFLRTGFINNQYLMKANKWIPPNLGVTDKCQHVDLITKRLENVSLTHKEEFETIQIRHTKKKMSGKNENLDKTLFGTGTITHNFNLRSVYDHVTNNQVEGTTFQDRWLTCDYIFYSGKKPADNVNSGNKLMCLSRFTLPLEGELKSVTIPNKDLGSDHLSLAAKFKLEF